ncbi:pyruvate dehydrogenase [acetyl-transferring]-phosphatase 1, mitochondrial [Periplaneta americana]|uniref:pyruvate dehydrogenase [acetyl-transferring]-phosphatase 1, mitochondrial n=1 Tax=Periplaneta americana TaxID=6978 RepID=UPI0037E75B58
MAIGSRAQQLVANKCFGKCTVRSADYHKRAAPFCTFNKNVIHQSNDSLQEQCNYKYRTFYTSKKLAATPRLSPQEVTNILRANEHSQEFTAAGSVRSYDSNQLQSNNPIEDTRSEARCLLTKGMLLGVFDGHGGAACAQVIAKRLLHYITACLLPPDILHKYLNALENNQAMQLLDTYNDKLELMDELKVLYEASFKAFVRELCEAKDGQGEFHMKEAMEKAFLRLDGDMSNEALANKANTQMLSVAMSGAVACVAHIDGPHLHVASAGDCQGVLGVLSDVNTWTAKMLTTEHNTDNVDEVQRILQEHPHNERDTIIKTERLLGQLAPLRALGDFKYKWSKGTLSSTLLPLFGESVIPPNYYTPPYLTARPEVTHHRLTPRDKFLVIASDGLWDLVSPLQVVRLVGEHMSGKVTLSPFRLPRKDMRIADVNRMLLQRKEGLKMKPIDRNAATHLLRNALGGTEYGIDHTKLSQLLSMPQEMVRVFRDDITITVVYFDSEYLRHCPP